MYADDLVIYYQANENEAKEVINCLNTYCEWTGQNINWDKSVVHFRRNTIGNMKAKVLDILNMKECSHNDTYLGNLFCRFKTRKEAFQPLLDKLTGKLMGWKEKALSLAGRSVLAKVVAMSIPTYVM